MQIKNLKLTNFKGLKDFELNPDCKDVAIYGDNGTGKTTIADSIYWLLFDKDSHMKKQFKIKSLYSDGSTKHGLDHIVEGTFNTDTATITLKKIYREKWSKKRGDAKKTFTGHTTEYEINGVPVKKTEYIERTSEIFDEETFKMLTTPTYFAKTLGWKKRRDILVEICGDVDINCVLESEKLAGLKGLLSDRNISDFRKIIAGTKKSLNEQIEKIPTRIDEVTHGMPDISNIDVNAENHDVDMLTKEIAEKEKQLVRLETGGEIAELTKQLKEIEAQLLDIENECKTEHSKKVDAQRDMISRSQEKHAELTSEIDTLNRSHGSRLNKIEATKRDMSELRITFQDVQHEAHAIPNIDEICPACEQPIPAEKIEEAKQIALELFNINKSSRLEKINIEGKELTLKLEQLINEEAKKRDERHEKVDIEKSVFRTLSSHKDSLAVLLKHGSNICEKVEYAQLRNQSVKTISKIKAVETELDGEIFKLKNNITLLNRDLAAANSKLNEVAICEKSKKRITELETEERELSAKYEEIERQFFLIEEFEKTQAELLETKVNEHFKLARFKLFEQQINGGIQPCCEVTYNGVPYTTDLNDGARINVGLDIITTLQKHYKQSPFVIIDNHESVTSIPEMNCQVIGLFVSVNDQKLRVEV